MKIKRYPIKELWYDLYLCFGDIEDFKVFYKLVSWDKLSKKDMKQSWISIVIWTDIFCMVHADSQHDYVDVMIHEVAHVMAELFTYIGEKIKFESEFWANYCSYYIREWINFLIEIQAIEWMKNAKIKRWKKNKFYLQLDNENYNIWPTWKKGQNDRKTWRDRVWKRKDT